MCILFYLLLFKCVCGLYIEFPEWGTSIIPGSMDLFDSLSKANVGAASQKDTEYWLEQPVDHFDTKDTRRWNMRYFKDLEFFKPKGPLYFIIGPPMAAFETLVQFYAVYDLAKETNGAMFLNEHRFYGKSLPFNETDMLKPDNIKYLTSEQVMADVAHLIETIKSSPEYKESKVVVLGFMQGGSRAAWMRLKYPQIVDAAWASSAPVLAKTDVFEYYEKIGENYKKYGSSECYDKIAQRFDEYAKLLQSADGIKKLKKDLNICDFCDLTDPLNQANFFLFVLTFEFTNPWYDPLNIQNQCSKMNDKWFSLSATKTSNRQNCNNVDYSFLLENTPPRYILGLYQGCNEFGAFFSTNSDKHPFGRRIPLEFYTKMCTHFFGPEYDVKGIDKNVARTNAKYGGLTPDVTKVVFVDGGMDAWEKIVIQKSLSDDAPAIIIPDGQFWLDFRRETTDDPKPLIEGRNLAKSQIKKWIGLTN